MEEEDKELISLLISLETRLKRRALRAPFRSPETLFEELEALKLVMDLMEKFKELGHGLDEA